MGKSTINGQFSIAMLVYRRVIEVQKAGRIEGPKSWYEPCQSPNSWKVQKAGTRMIFPGISLDFVGFREPG